MLNILFDFVKHNQIERNKYNLKIFGNIIFE
jgi:hypothetical protein